MNNIIEFTKKDTNITPIIAIEYLQNIIDELSNNKDHFANDIKCLQIGIDAIKKDCAKKEKN